MPEPDFVGVGALHCGGAWWHRLLLDHPAVARPVPARRTGGFFAEHCARELREDDVARYHARFPREPGQLAGEWGPRYLFDAWTAPLLRRVAPDARLLVMLRDPIDRYLAIAGKRAAEHDGAYLADTAQQSRFGSQLRALHAWFARERILVLQLERCRADVAGEYRRTLRFLGLADHKPSDAALRAAEAVLARVPGGPRLEPWPELQAALHTALDPEIRLLRELAPELDVGSWPHVAAAAAQASSASAV